MRAATLYLPLLIAGCAPAATAPLPPPTPITAQSERVLAGKVAGEPVSCLRAIDARNPVTLENGVAYRVSSKLAYVQQFNGQCSRSMLRNGFLVRRSTQTQLCRGDIASVNDRTSNILLGSCVYDDFIPYRTPG